jgi:hypothetical protein
MYHLLGLEHGIKNILGVTETKNFPDELTIPNSGSCISGTSYQLNGYDDLVANIDDLECIFHAGYGLTQPPVGAMYGQLLLAVNSEIPRFFANPFYQGDYGYQTACFDESNVWTEHYLSQLRITPGVKLGVSKNTISPFPVSLRQGEVRYLGDPSRGTMDNPLVMDFTVNTEVLCPLNHNGSGKAVDLKNKTMDPFGASLPPVNGYVDFGVIVGQYQLENGRTRTILLNKAMAYDDTNDEFSTILYYTVEIEDPTVVPSGVALDVVTVPYSFEYTRPVLPSPESIIYSISKTADAFLEPVMRKLRNKIVSKTE